ncbi:hypothetical protein N8Z24_00120 [bacterium]|nr:hypothetical protein [bacterium]
MYNMLTIHAVNPTGMFSYGLCDTVHVLNKGLIYLEGINEDKDGDSNGSGKTSFFNAICELLFRENPTGEKGDAAINSVWGRGFAGRIIFTNWKGDHYRITYCRKWKDPIYPADNDNKVQYIGTGLFLDYHDAGIWRDSRGSGMPSTHKKILEIIGMSYNQFLSISYLSHRVGNRFLRGSNKERMDLLSGITGIEEWDKILDECRSQKKIINNQIGDLEQRVAFEKGAVQTLQEQFQQAKAFDWELHIRNLEDKLENQRSQWKVTQAKIDQLTYQIGALKKEQENSFDKDKMTQINQEVHKLNQDLTSLERRLSGSEFQVSPDASLQKDLNAVNSEVYRAKGVLSAYLGEAGSILDMKECPTCKSKITKAKKEAITEKVAGLKGKIEALGVKVLNARKLLDDDFELKKKDAEEDRERLSNEANRVRITIQRKIDESNKEHAAYVSFEPEIQKYHNQLYTLQKELQTYETEGVTLKAQIESAQKAMSDINALEEQISEKKRHVVFYETEVQTVRGNLNVYLWLIDNIPYIKLHKLSTAMADISDLCNQYFSDMGDSLRIGITSFEEKAKKKNAADVKDLMKSEIKVEITDGSKNISPKLWSDGELSKVSLAVVRALHGLANRSGQGCNLMLMDEIFSFVDSNNSQKIAASISNSLKKGTVFLTDNSGSVKDLLNFDHNWIARKSEGQTVLEVDR